MATFEENGSGWVYQGVSSLQVSVNEVHFSAGSSFIKLPNWIQRKNAVLNIVNFDDNNCFIYCILAHLCPTQSKFERFESYPRNFDDYMNLHNIQMPIKICDIGKFEKINPSISVNVFGVEGTKIIGPLYHTKNRKEHHVNLLFLQNGENSHYCLIKDLGKLIGSDISKHKVKKFICDSCLNHFTNKNMFDLHQKDCNLFDPVRIFMPEKGSPDSVLQFNSHKAMMRKSFIIAADFECLTLPIEKNTPTTKSSFLYQKHDPVCVGFTTVCSFESKYNKYTAYHGKNPEKWFVSELKLECERIYQILISEDKPMTPLSPEQQTQHDMTDKCPICDCFFTDNNCKVLHHNHYTGKFESTCCNNCNLKIKKDFSIPIFLHNMSRYDAHLFIRELNLHSSVSVIPMNTQNYISFSVWLGHVKLVFLDSFRFLPASLQKLVGNLAPDQLKITKSYFTDDEQFKLVTRKGVYPYDFMDSESKLKETKLPAKKYFYNQLTSEHISDDEYSHAQTVWKKFNCTTLLDYTMLYLKSDVLLLADVIENFRDLTLKYYSLDAAHFYTAPGLSWQAALKLTKVKLELITDVDQYNFIAKGLRGGICNSIERYAKSNNPYVADFDPDKEISYIHYLDFNSLYGFSLSEPLPVGDFSWLSENEIERIQTLLLTGEKNYKSFLSFDSQKDKSFILEVDLLYDENLHDSHNQMPFCPEHIIPKNCKQTKLVCSLHNKLRYVIHIKNLIHCLEHGLKLTKIHRILEFTESPWLKPYIELNTKFRTASRNEFEKTFFKLMVNAIFGKTLENERNKREIKLVNNWKSARKLILKPNFHRSIVIDEHFVIIEFKKTEIHINKPIFCGFSVLELSKLKMYSFHYDYIIKNLSEWFKINLCYQDTDSLVYNFILKENVDKNFSFYDIMRRDALTHFDTSDYPQNNVFAIPLVNAKVPGVMKDEIKGQILKEWISLRAKVYCMKIENPVSENYDAQDCKTIRKIKGVGKSATKEIQFEDFYNCLFKNKNLKASFNTIQSKNHTLFSLNVHKVALDYSDNKRCILEDKISTLAWGHYLIQELDE